ncbi:MAG: tRNA (adenosine(37)-N6)-dimethylallyltransferase MiaA [Proteobacteria bacterium]|nr:tRNA (adenosine(37)-N6)-dimethylallyltransferase MiaA [Pseudomonadota bacterium]MBU1743087.1 tRNA (adenosine(37)-N6)-dimethylallyltransferase MiaA [Pseudomonadota bacterium]
MIAGVSAGRVSDARLVVLVGPTAVGKTAAAIHLSRKFDAEIVGADSVQLYRRLDVGSAKPTPFERLAVPHHLIDALWPDEPCSAADYVALADAAITDIHGRGRRVVVVGGTGLYLRALLHGLFALTEEQTAAARRVRARLLAEEAREPGRLHRRLQEVDPVAAARLSPADTIRVSRALEVLEATGRPISELQATTPDAPRYAHLVIGLDRAREELYVRIDRRCRAMLGQEFFAEVRDVLNRGYDPDLGPLRSLGYRHLIDLLWGRVSRIEMERRFRRDTRRYAKRQLTWFRKDDTIWWCHPDDLAALVERTGQFWTP